MKNEHRGLLAIALSALVLFGWMRWFAPQPSPEAAKTAATENLNSANQAPQTPLYDPFFQPKPDPQNNEPEQILEFNNPLYIAKVSSVGGGITSWIAQHYKNGKEASLGIDLAQNGGLKVGFKEQSFFFPDNARFRLVSSSSNDALYQWSSDEVDVKLSYTFLQDRYVSDVALEITNKTARELQARPFLRWEAQNTEAPGGMFSGGPSPRTKHPLYLMGDEVVRKSNTSKLASEDGPEPDEKGKVAWVGVEDRYFVSAIIPRNDAAATASFGATGQAGNGQAQTINAGVYNAKLALAPGQTARQQFSVYVGPKDLEQLRLAGAELDRTIDYGWFAWAAHPILYLLKLFYKGVHNYGLAIILLTVFIKILLNPITKKSMKSMKAMQQLQPKLKKLQEKYKNDKVQLQQETMQLFRTHKVNPAGGCLPMLLQFPIYIALYKVLFNGIELYHAPFVGWYKDLAAPDPYFILPIILGLCMVLQQKTMPSASMDPAQKKMMMFMPIMFTMFMLFLPVGLVLYILVNTSLSIGQQWMYTNDISFKDLVTGKWRKISV